VKILVVECVICEQERITKNLNDYEVTTACDGDWAFAYLRTYPCDLVLIGRFNGSRIKETKDLVEAIRIVDPSQPVVVLRKPYNTKRLLKWVAQSRKPLPLFDSN
jgi:hypothetical protein